MEKMTKSSVLYITYFVVGHVIGTMGNCIVRIFIKDHCTVAFDKHKTTSNDYAIHFFNDCEKGI